MYQNCSWALEMSFMSILSKRPEKAFKMHDMSARRTKKAGEWRGVVSSLFAASSRVFSFGLNLSMTSPEQTIISPSNWNLPKSSCRKITPSIVAKSTLDKSIIPNKLTGRFFRELKLHIQATKMQKDFKAIRTSFLLKNEVSSIKCILLNIGSHLGP